MFPYVIFDLPSTQGSLVAPLTQSRSENTGRDEVEREALRFLCIGGEA
jgi:hypothetical protein